MIDLVSWNVLADAYVRAEYFPSTPAALLVPGARTGAITARLGASAADIVCLQEVEPALVTALRGLPSFEVRTLRKGRGKPDGCALLTRRERVVVEELRELVYPDGSGHVAMLAIVRVEGERLGVATTHVKWDPPGTAEADRWATRQFGALVSAMKERDVAWVACGDFNVTPDDPVLGVLRDGHRDVYAGTAEEKPTVNANGRPKRIDYVFADDRLRATPRALADLDAATPLPSAREPSDHLPIGALLSRA
ncbi:MAG: endonuclease/exonuclease/phosphatase family protein [Polyangiaceae bacterium]